MGEIFSPQLRNISHMYFIAEETIEYFTIKLNLQCPTYGNFNERFQINI